jgi:hypothetical protein
MEETLLQEIRAHGLGAFEAEILSTMRPAIYLEVGASGLSEVGPALGQSRIGGQPDLPLSWHWPKAIEYPDKYLCFILQINLAELPTFPGSPFPAGGMLYLFVNAGEDSAEQILLFSGDEPFHRASPPAAADFIADWYDDLVLHPLKFRLGADIPRWASDDFYALCQDDNFLSRLNSDQDSEPSLEERLDDLGRSLSAGSIGKLLGHVSGIGHDPRRDAYIVREVNPEWLYDSERQADLEMTLAYQWQNLLQVDSINAVNLMFGDAGYLQLLIHAQDLFPLNVSNVYVDLVSS